MVYKPLAVRVALIAGFRRALPVFRYMIVAVVAVGMWESLRDFQGMWECGTPALWLSKLSIPRDFHGLLDRRAFKSPDLAHRLRIESRYANIICWPPDRRRCDSGHGAG